MSELVGPAQWPKPGSGGTGGGGGPELTVNSGPLHSSGLLPLAVTSQPLVPPDGIIQPLPPLAGFQFPGTRRTITVSGMTRPQQICAGPDGNLYLSSGIPTGSSGALYRVSLAGAVSHFTFPTTFDTPVTGGLCVGSDGNLWVTGRFQVIKFDLSTTTFDTPITLPSTRGGAGGICAGPDGSLWVTGTATVRVWRVTTTGTVTPFTCGTHTPTNPTKGYGYQICAGPDGKLWTGDMLNAAVRVIATDGTFTTVPLTGATDPGYFATGPDGNVWVTVTRPPGVWRITPAGVATFFALPTSQPAGIVAGAGGDLWIADSKGTTAPVGTTTGGLWRVTVHGVATKFLSGHAIRWICVGDDGGLWMSSYDSDVVSASPFLLQTGGLVLTALPTTDPTNAGEVWADNGTLVQSGHTAGGGATFASISGSASVVIPGNTTGSVPVTGTLTDPTTLITAVTAVITIKTAGVYSVAYMLSTTATSVAATEMVINQPGPFSTQFTPPAAKGGFITVSYNEHFPATSSVSILVDNRSVASRTLTCTYLTITKLG